MHVVFLTDEYPYKEFSHGGIGSFVQNLAQNLVKNNFRVTVIGITKEVTIAVENDKGVFVHRIKQSKSKFGKFIFNSYRIRKKIKKIHQEYPIDIVEGAELSFTFLPKITPYKKVIRMHGGHHFFAVTLNKKPALWRSFQEIQSFKKADALIAVSNYVGETTKQLVKFKLPYQVIYNFIDLNRFKNTSNDTYEENTIVFVGTICEKKGVKQLVEAFPYIKEKAPSAILHLVGRDWSSKIMKSYISYLKTLIAKEHLKDIIFHGSVPYDTIPTILEKAHVCVYPSHMESFGLTVVEAMAMVKPIVFSNIPPFKEIIKDKETGLACNPFSKEDIALKIIELFKNPEEVKRMGKNAQQEALIKFDSEVILQENINYYKSLI